MAYKKAVLFIAILTLLFATACGNNGMYMFKINRPLFVQTTAGTEVIDLNKLEVASNEPMDISSGGYGIASSKNFLYLSDSGFRSEFARIGGNQLHQFNISKGTVKTIKAPSVDDLIVYRKKVYGLYEENLGFIYDEEKEKLRKFRIEEDIDLIGFINDKTLVVNNSDNALGFLEGSRVRKQLILDDVITQAILNTYRNNNVILAFVGSEQVGSEINLIDVPDFKILKKLKPKPKNAVSEGAFIYNNKLYYSSSRPEGKKYFSSDYVLNVLDLASYKAVNKIKLPAIPYKVLYSKGKIYFIFIEGRKKSNVLVVVDSKTSKILKELKVGKNVSDMILINDKLFVANTDIKTISIIDVSKLHIEKTLKLQDEPVVFATPMPAVRSIKIGL